MKRRFIATIINESGGSITLLHQLLIGFHVHTFPFCKHHFGPSWSYTEEQHAIVCSDVLEGMNCFARDEDRSPPNWNSDELVNKQELEMCAPNVSELVLIEVQMRWRAASGGDCLPEQTRRSAGLFPCCEQFRYVTRTCWQTGCR